MLYVFLIIIIAGLGLVNFILYYSFYIPEHERREAFKRLNAEEIEELRNTMTADHFFRVSAETKLPEFKMLKKLTRRKKTEL